MPPRKKPARRAKGTGTVYQRKDGLWIAEQTVGGKTTRRAAKTEKLALARLALALKGTGVISTDDPTLQEYLTKWVEECPRLADGTRYGYRLILSKHCYPTIGSIRLRELKVTDVKRCLAQMRHAELSASSIRGVRNAISSGLADAREDGLIDTNPARVKVAGPPNAASSVSISIKEAADLLELVSEHRLADLWSLLLYSGGRLGEVLGLEWPAVKLAQKKLLIRRQDGVVADPENPLRVVRGFKKPKTEAGVREVPLPDEAVRLLWRRYSKMGRPKSGLVFPSPTNLARPFDPKQANREFREFLASKGHPPITQHTLRHYCATILIGKGVPIPTVSRILGHRNSAITMRIYAHVITEAAAKEIEVMRFFPDTPTLAERSTKAAERRLQKANKPHEVGPISYTTPAAEEASPARN